MSDVLNNCGSASSVIPIQFSYRLSDFKVDPIFLENSIDMATMLYALLTKNMLEGNKKQIQVRLWKEYLNMNMKTTTVTMTTKTTTIAKGSRAH